MASFKQVVKNYQNLAKLGQQIIHHKENIKHIKPSQLDNEFLKQELRIEEFFEKADQTHTQWHKNSNLIHEYWTGLS